MAAQAAPPRFARAGPHASLAAALSVRLRAAAQRGAGRRGRRAAAMEDGGDADLGAAPTRFHAPPARDGWEHGEASWSVLSLVRSPYKRLRPPQARPRSARPCSRRDGKKRMH